MTLNFGLKAQKTKKQFKMARKRVSSGVKWEDIVAYSRAVQIGKNIEVAGTTSVDANGNFIGENDPYEQTLFIIRKAEKALNELGADLNDVIRTRIYVTNIADWEEVGKAHGDCFRGIYPATTLVEVGSLIDPRLLVEIEFSAVVE